MSGLVERGRQEAARRDAENEIRVRSARLHMRAAVARAAAHTLGLDSDAIEPEALRVVAGEESTMPDQVTALFAFEVDGLEFVAGRYWTGNPGAAYLVALRLPHRQRLLRPRRPGRLQWPPPHPLSASNTGWAPAGYVPVHSAASVARIVDGARQ